MASMNNTWSFRNQLMKSSPEDQRQHYNYRDRCVVEDRGAGEKCTATRSTVEVRHSFPGAPRLKISLVFKVTRSDNTTA